MGVFSKKSCYTSNSPNAIPGNPSPDRWVLLDIKHFPNAHVLKVKYLDCTNYEGVKILVFKGSYKERKELDPHFSEQPDSPIARFIPTDEGMEMAITLAKKI